MISIEEKNKCCGCGACFNACPTKAISMKEDEEGFDYPQVEEKKCIGCGLCEKCCPILYEKGYSKSKPKAYACFNRDDDIRLKSSSGGIFSILADKVVETGGIVFGAGYDENFNVIHQSVKAKEKIENLRRSKYVQSNTQKTFIETKEALENGEVVLYTGTPCQIEGLKLFLKKDYENLLTQDIICHGVPSPKVWKKYLEFRKIKDKQEPINVNFRNKNTGWKLLNLVIKYQDGEFQQSADKNSYMQAFLKNTSLRESCYNCHFKKIDRVSDITLADFWGVENIIPEMDDNKGTSLMIIHSKKGNEWFEKIKYNIKYQEVDLEEAIKYNPSIVESAKMDKNRKKFFEKLDKENDFDVLVKKFSYKPNLIKKILKKILRVLRIRK